MRLTATTALHQFGGLTDHLTRIHALGHEVISKRYCQRRLSLSRCTDDYKQTLRHLGTQLEDKILSALGVDSQHLGDDLDSIHLTGFLYQTLFQFSHLLGLECLHLLLQVVVLVDVLLYSGNKVGCVVEERLDLSQSVLYGVEHFLHSLACNGLDTAHTSGNGTL